MLRTFPLAAPAATATKLFRRVAVVSVLWSLVTIAIVPAVVRGLVAIFWIPIYWIIYRVASRMGRVEFQIEGGVFSVRGDLWSRKVPLSAIRLDEAKLLILTKGSPLEPTLRVGGTGLPGYLSGWFRLRSREKAFLYLTDWSKAVYMPTTLGYSLLLSPDDPQAFLDAVRSA